MLSYINNYCGISQQMNQLYGVVLMKQMVVLVTNNYKIMVVYYQLNYKISEHID